MERTSTSSLWGAGLAAERPSRFSAASVDRDPTPAVRKLRNARLLVAGSGLISVTFLTTLTSLTIMDYHLLIKEIPGSKSTALAAAVLDPFSLVALIFLIAFNLMTPGQGWTTRVVLPLSGALVAVAGACLSLSAMLIESSETKKSSQKHTAASDFSVKIGVWIIALLSQLAFYSLVLLGRHLTDASQTKLASRRPLAHEEKGARIAPKRPPTPPSPLRMVAPPYALPQASASFIEPEPESRRSSWRKSLHNIQQAVRPISLKSSLGGQRGSSLRDSTSAPRDSQLPIGTARTSDAFENWDIPSIDQKLRDAIIHAMPTRPGRTALEPIPGSRPVSLARPLDGPFPLLPSPETPRSPEPGDRPNTGGSALSRGERPPTNYSHKHSVTTKDTLSRPTSPLSVESNIHPLFRSDSPVPPPAATPGTTITASPFSGRVIMASSRASSRTRVPTIGRAASIEDIARASRSRSSSVTRVPSRSSSVTRIPSRAVTPPIPEFVLSASRERSL